MKRKFSQLAPLTLVAALLVAAATAKAQPTEGKDFYVGTSLGATAVKAKGLDVDNNGRATARASAGLFAGARLGSLPVGAGLPVYVEAGYQGIGRHQVPYKMAGGGVSDLTIRGHSLYLASKVDLPLSEQFAVYGKLGVSRNTVDGSTPAQQAPIAIDGSRTSALVGVGAQYRLVSGLILRAEFTSLGKTSRNSDGAAASVGVAYAF
jgi:opacity protein-like surface antigen